MSGTAAPFADVDPVVLRLRYLFSDDPFTNRGGRRGRSDDPEQVLEPGSSGSDLPSPAKFCSWFELEREYDTFCFHLEEYLDTLQERRRAHRAGRGAARPGALARIETSLATHGPVRPDPSPGGLRATAPGQPAAAVRRDLRRDPRARHPAGAGRRSDRRHVAVPAARRVARPPSPVLPRPARARRARRSDQRQSAPGDAAVARVPQVRSRVPPAGGGRR